MLCAALSAPAVARLRLECSAEDSGRYTIETRRRIESPLVDGR